jgi:hypothetical protein
VESAGAVVKLLSLCFSCGSWAFSSSYITHLLFYLFFILLDT